MNKKLNFTNEQIAKIRNQMTLHIIYSLIGDFSKKMRGITLDFDGQDLVMEMIFDDELTEEEEENMDFAHTRVAASIFPNLFDDHNNVILSMRYFELKLMVIDTTNSILDKKGNLGWFYLRKEY
jgi:hypothetical protein